MNSNIFIYWDVHSKKEYLLKAFIEIYLAQKNIDVVLIDPKMIEFEDFKNDCYYWYVIHEFEDFKNKFNTLKNIESKKIIIINEIADFIYNKDTYNDFLSIINYIKSTKNMNFIISTQRNINCNDYSNKLDSILNDNYLIKLIF